MRSGLRVSLARLLLVSASILAVGDFGGCGDGFGLEPIAHSQSAISLYSQNDPHAPKRGPWFEGWYTRISDINTKRSLAVIAASHVPKGTSYTPGEFLPGYIAVLIGEGEGAKTLSFEVYPERTRVLVDGQPVTTNPDFRSESDFEWTAPGFGRVTQNSVDISIPGLVEVQSQAFERLPWNSRFSQIGPEGLLAFLPLPLHWHIESLGSNAEYEYTIYPGGDSKTVTGRGYAHLEKNWGLEFPIAWVWSQGITDSNQTQFVLGGGVVALGAIVIQPWIVGFRSPALSWDFRFSIPGTHFRTEVDACRGTFLMEASDAFRTLSIQSSAPSDTFGDVSIPTEDGFVPQSGQESLSTSVSISAYRKRFGRTELVDQREFRNAVLEFGADYVCQ